MATTDAVLRGAVSGVGADLTLTLDPAFQGLPETAHGGSVLAAFDAIAALDGPRTVVGHHWKRVPLATPLQLRVAHDRDRVTCRLLDAESTLLVDGHITADAANAGGAKPTDGGAGGAAAESASRSWARTNGESPPSTTVGPTDSFAAPPAPPPAGFALPVSRTCFACGVENRLGLRVQLMADDRAVGGTWTPRGEFAGADGALAPVALTTLLDEAAFWLGALATGESGMTTELAVTLHRAVRADATLTIVGGRGAVRQRADDGRYWDTRVEARDSDGVLVASGAITFVAVRGAARRLATGLLALNPPALLRRIFPAYVR